MSDAYFGNADSKATLASLQATPDGVLVSDETVGDFQLKEGDTINLCLQFASDHAYHVVPFKFIGIAREFPTAPKSVVFDCQCKIYCQCDRNPDI